MEAKEMPRSEYVGAYDVAAMAGLTPKTPAEVYYEKIDPQPMTPTDAMTLGLRLEPALLDILDERLCATGLRHRFYYDKPGGGHPDAAYEIGGERYVADVKLVGAHRAHQFGPEFTDRFPGEYHAQLQWYCGLAKASGAYLFALIGSTDARLYYVDADPEIYAALRVLAVRLWDAVQRRSPIALGAPPPSVLLSLEMRKERGATHLIAADHPAASDYAALFADFEAAKTAIEEAEARKDAAKAAILERMGEAEIVEIAGLGKVTYKRTADSVKTDWAALTSSGLLSADTIRRFTKPHAGTRRFLISHV